MHQPKNELPVVFEEGAMSFRQAECGAMLLAVETAPAGMDNAPLFKGLPDDRCQCPHWGYMFKGNIRVRYADHEEVISAGDVYYLAPGHTIMTEQDCELVEFSPKDEYQATMEVAMRNMAATQAS